MSVRPVQAAEKTPGVHFWLTILHNNDGESQVINAGLDNGVPFYDTVAMERIGYDAVNLGTRDFDFGPDLLADVIDRYTYPPPHVSAHLDFSGEPHLQASVDADGDLRIPGDEGFVSGKLHRDEPRWADQRGRLFLWQ